MSLDVLGYVIAGLFAFAAAVYTTWATRKAKETQDAVEKVRADGESYERAQAINKEIVVELREEVDRLRSQLAELRVQLRAEEARSSELDAKVELLQRSVNRLRALLVEHDIPIPAEAS